MRGTVAKNLRRSARQNSKGEDDYKKTYKHMKANYNKHGTALPPTPKKKEEQDEEK